MNNLETACLLSCERWVDTFEKEIPEHTFSKEHNEKMKPLLSDNLIKYKPKLSKKTLKFILIAAIIMSLAITVFVTAKPAFEKYSFNKYSDHSEYEVLAPKKKTKKVKSLTVNYIPEDFEKTDSYKSEYQYMYKYEKGNEYFVIEKTKLNLSINYDIEHTSEEIIKIDGNDVICRQGENGFKDYLYNDGNYIYSIYGNISDAEFVNIIQNIQ